MRYFKIDLNAVLKISELYYEELIPPRRHSARCATDYILYAITEGTLHLEDNGKSVTLRPGDIYIFKKGELHKPTDDSECKYIYVHFNTESIEEVNMSVSEFKKAVEDKQTNLLKADRFVLDCYEYMYVFLAQKVHIDDAAAFNNIVKELRKHFIAPNCRKAGECLAVSFSMARIFMELENIQMMSRADRTEKDTSKTYATVKGIANFIEETYTRNVSRGELEKKFYLNFDYANRIFKKHTGQSISKYKNMVRIRVAKSLMVSSSKTLGEIAEEIGFRDQYYFSRVFKQLEGVSPSEYMRRAIYAASEDE